MFIDSVLIREISMLNTYYLQRIVTEVHDIYNSVSVYDTPMLNTYYLQWTGTEVRGVYRFSVSL